jgi:hypothetical protein
VAELARPTCHWPASPEGHRCGSSPVMTPRSADRPICPFLERADAQPHHSDPICLAPWTPSRITSGGAAQMAASRTRSTRKRGWEHGQAEDRLVHRPAPPRTRDCRSRTCRGATSQLRARCTVLSREHKLPLDIEFSVPPS